MIGNCYGDAFDILMMKRPSWILCHGVCIGTGGEAKGKEFGHAWIEKDDVVIDSRGQELPKPLFYAIGRIGYVARYSLESARKMIVENKTYGPWDKEVSKAIHNKILHRRKK